MATEISTIKLKKHVLLWVKKRIYQAVKSTNWKDNGKVVEVAEKIGATIDDLSPVGKLIEGIMTHSSKAHAVVIKSGPEFIDDDQPTPSEHTSRDKHCLHDLDLLRVILIGAARGCAYSYSDQANGNLCDDVMPIASAQTLKGFSQGSEVGWHTEDAAFNTDFFNCAFDAISMAFYRNLNHDHVYISHPDLTRLDRETLDLLREPQFPSLTSLAQKGDQNHVSALKSVVYSGSLLRFSFARYDELRRSGLSRRQIEALEDLKEELDASEAKIDIEPGDIVFVDNMRAAHRRAPWRSPPRFDGTDRWQRRLGFASARNFRNFSRILGCGESRVIDNKILRDVLNQVPMKPDTEVGDKTSAIHFTS